MQHLRQALIAMDFGTWQEAKAWFEAHGGSPTNNVEQLDGMTENNKGEVGIACESNKGYAGQTLKTK
jgi:hypothetical protein